MKKLYQKMLAVVLVAGGIGFSTSAYAMTPSLSIYAGSNSTVTLTISNADANSAIFFYYNTPNYGGTQNAYLGTTNYSGYFSTSIAYGQYNITSGSSVYVMVNGQQSSSYAWPYTGSSNYYPYNTNGLTVSSLTLPVGGSATLSSQNAQALYVSSNSNQNVVSTSNNNYNNAVSFGCNGGWQYNPQTGQPCYSNSYNYNYSNYNNYGNTSVQLNALTQGTSTVSICQSNGSNCSSINVTVIGGVNLYNYNTNTPQVLGACYFSTTLRRSMAGSDVQCLQDTLVNMGYLSYGNFSPALFDLNTWNAVVSFQRNHGLGADGVVGYMTRNALFRSY